MIIQTYFGNNDYFIFVLDNNILLVELNF